MRIGVVTTSYPRSPGEPAGNFVAELNEWISGRGHEVEVLAAGTGNEDDSWQEFPVQRVRATGLFYQGGAPDALKDRRNAWAALGFSSRLVHSVRKRSRHWDGMVAHWLAPSAMACALASRRKPLWAIAHGGDVYLLEKLGLTPWVARLLDRPHVHVSFVSGSAQEVFARSAGKAGAALIKRSVVCPMGIDLQHFRTLKRAKSDKPSLLFLGRLVPIKGADILLDAVARLERDCELVIAGAGPQREALERQALRLGVDVRWPGEVRGDERDRLLAEADLVVVPSREHQGRSEGMPRVALEALAVGAQLLVCSSGGLAEIPESSCRRVPPDDPLALSLAIGEILDGRTSDRIVDPWIDSRDWFEVAPRLLPGLS